jgi:hypothetical protein
MFDSIVSVVGFMAGANVLAFGGGLAVVKFYEVREQLKAGEQASKLLHAHRLAVGTAKSVEIEQGVF